MARTGGLHDDKRLESRVARMPPDAHALTLLPFLAGERSPDYIPDARAVIAGLRLATTRDDIFRAALESVGYQFLEVLEELVTVSPVTRLVATGTALTSSRIWQILADALGQPIAVPRATELTSRGAAIVGFEQIGQPPHPRWSRRSRASSIPTRAATRSTATPPRASGGCCALC